MKFRQEAKDKSGTASSLGNIGLVYMAIGNAERALEYFQKSLALHLETGNARLTTAYSNIGRAYNELGNIPTALEYFQKALKNAETIGEKKNIAIAHYHIGNILKNSGRYDQAIQHFRDASNITEELGDRKWMANSLHGLALIYSQQNNPSQAFENNEKAIQIAREIGFMDTLSSALYLQAQLKRKQGEMEEAIRAMKESINLIEDVRVNLQLEEEKAVFFGEKQDLYVDLIQMLLENGNNAEALEYAERSKARAFIDMLAESNIDPNRKLDEKMKEKKLSLETKYAELHKKLWTQRDSNESEKELLKKLNEQRKTLDAEYESWKRDIRSQNPEYADLNYPVPLQLQQIQQLLDEKTALLEYTAGVDSSFLFLITNDGLESFVIPGEKEISTRVREFQKLILNPEPLWEKLESSETKLKAVSKELYRILVKPAASQIANKQRLVIAPDGVLNHLPFEALMNDKRAGEYLVSDFQIHYIPSSTALAQIRQRIGNSHKAVQKQFLAFADPNYGSPEGTIDLYRIGEFFGKVSGLPNTKTEVEEIAKLYRRNAVATFTGEAASEKNVKSIKLDDYKKVHFATHGLINEAQPQFSSLLLSFNQNEKEDGYLMMREIFDLKLNAELVVLSACRTGLGQEIRGEGVRSLARAFIYAGTPSVLVTLWNVSDKSTADFMKMFYSKMEKEHLNKAAALRAARLQMIRGKKYSHPYYWAPFVLIGDQ
jgi:CHAT domain-containing protein/Tfp pilus assembly protein PilF